jgi:2-phospho-L-lactate guanylyltransferase
MRVALVPMKPLARAKERLARVLSADERRALSLAMLTDVVASCGVLDETWVVCSDGDAAETARAMGARAVLDPTPDDGLNASMNAVTEQAHTRGASGVLVISADCPCVSPDDVRAMAPGDGIALGPNRYGTGTNAIWRFPPDLIPLSFGPNSRRAHEGLAVARGIPCVIVARPGIALDIDTPADLRAAAPIAGPATRELLARLGYPRASGGDVT